MKERLSIVLTDVNGSKHYNINTFIKKIIFYIILLFILVFIIAIFFISYLSDSVDKLESKKLYLEKTYKKLENDNIQIIKTITSKEEELELLNTKMKDLEELIGTNPFNEYVSLNQRVYLAKMTFIQKKFLLQNIPNGYPLNYKGITSKFGWRKHPIHKKRHFHSGIDLKAKLNTKVFATADGIVNFAAFHKKNGYGKMIILSHNYGFSTLYAHLNTIKVKHGTSVKKGDLIGYTGNTGLSNGPHLHYEIRYLQVGKRPDYFMKWNMKNYDIIFKKEKYIKWQSLINLVKSQTNQLMKQQ